MSQVLDKLTQSQANLFIAARKKLLQVLTPQDIVKMDPLSLLTKFQGCLFPLTPNEVMSLVKTDPMIWHWFTGVDLADTRLDSMRCKAVDALKNVLEIDNFDGNPKVAQLQIAAAKIILEQSKPPKPEQQVALVLPKAVKSSSVRELEERKQQMLAERERRG